ncbi:MAG: serine hydrolase [Bacillota bacterium]
MKELEKIIRRRIEGLGGEASILVKDADTGERITINEGKSFHAASIIKLPILWEALKQVEEGKRTLQDIVILQNSDKVGGCGVLPILHEGLALTLEDLLFLMTDISDNTATNMLIDVLGLENINRRIQSLGMKDTKLARKLMIIIPGVYNYTCAFDVANILERFLKADGLKKIFAEKGLDILYSQQYNDRLSGELLLCGACGFRVGFDNLCSKCGAEISDVDALPIKFAHKTGEIVGTVHDAGIMHIGDRRIIIVGLTKNLKNNLDGYAFLKKIGLDIYNYYANQS